MDVGAQLREARESRGLSVAQLAATTRVHARVLAAIERNDLPALPPRPYARGFIAAYAREVGLDPDATVRSYFAQFEEMVSAAEAAPPPSVARVPFDASPWRRRMPVVLAVVMLVALVAVFAARLRQAPAGRADAVVGTTGATPPEGGLTGGVTRPNPDARRLDSAVPPAAVRKASGSPAPTALVISLEAEGASWVAATVDGTREIYGVLQPGTTRTLRASREVVLRVGDAGALRWSINGREPALMGRRGEVRTFRLTAGGN